MLTTAWCVDPSMRATQVKKDIGVLQKALKRRLTEAARQGAVQRCEKLTANE
jgi:DNA-binding HxlR family transcriptional regulator